MHLQPLYRDSEVAGGAVAERLYRQGLCLPSGSSLTPEQQDRVIAALRDILDADHMAEPIDLDARRAAQKDASSATSEQSEDQPSPA